MIDIQDHDGLRVLQMARAPVNALDPDLCGSLCLAINQAVADGCRGLVLAGGEKVFSAGLDVPYLASLGSNLVELESAWQSFFAAARALAASEIPVVAAITGHAPAGGCVLALCCDHRVMAEGAFQIGLNEVQVGLAVPEGIQRLMRRAVGPHRAAQLLMQGAMVDSTTALSIGLVDAVAPQAAVVETSLAWLRQLGALPRTPMLNTRRVARAELVEALQPDNLRLDSLLQQWMHPDTQQALQALLSRLGKR